VEDDRAAFWLDGANAQAFPRETRNTTDCVENFILAIVNINFVNKKCEDSWNGKDELDYAAKRRAVCFFARQAKLGRLGESDDDRNNDLCESFLKQ
jgi:hypothetical protein